jgi:hypothetical protein
VTIGSSDKEGASALPAERDRVRRIEFYGGEKNGATRVFECGGGGNSGNDESSGDRK